MTHVSFKQKILKTFMTKLRFVNLQVLKFMWSKNWKDCKICKTFTKIKTIKSQKLIPKKNICQT